MCDCGCNTCETKGPLLTEGKVKSLLSEGLQYHIDKKIPLFETVYRIGSDKHMSLIKEARKMYSRNIIDLCEDDEALIKTHLGEFALYEGVSVPLDLPMLEESYDYDEVAQLDENKVIDYIKNQGKEVVANLKAKIEKVITTAKEEGGETLQMIKLLAKEKRGTKLTSQESKLVSDQGKDLLKMALTGAGAASGFGAIVSVLPVTATIATLISAINFLDLDDELLKYTDSSKDSARGLTSVEKDKANFKDIGGVKYIKYDVVEPYLDQADAVAESLQETIKKVLDEKKAKKKKEKKDPPLNKPKRGGSKAYYVYVRDPKTKKIKKVSFGSGGLRAKIRNPKARKAFAARHNCKNKKDRTKAGYWSCNLPRYAPALGLGAKMNTFW